MRLEKECNSDPCRWEDFTSGAGVSQRTADFILSSRHPGYQQHVGHGTQAVIRGQASLFVGTS